MNPDDPKLTAYALDELDEAERRAIAREVASSLEAQYQIQETQRIARFLRAEFTTELEGSASAYAASQSSHLPREAPLRSNLNDIRDDPWFWTRARPLAIAAALAVFAVIGLGFFLSYQFRHHEIAQAGRRATETSMIDAEFEDAATSSSYATVRRFINEGVLPPKDTVRIEEMINHFTYEYPEPRGEQLLSLDVEVASCPWADSHRLVRIGLRGREAASSEADASETPSGSVKIAKEVVIQVEFNPAEVASYRLIGYEQPMPGKEGRNRSEIDVGEMDAGRSVTAFYDVVPAGTSANPVATMVPLDSGQSGSKGARSARESKKMLTIKLHYKKSNDDKSQLIQRTVMDDGKEFASASADFKFAAAVAKFGMLLHESEFNGNGTLGAVLEWAQEGKGTDANGYRAGFVDLVRKAQVLTRG